MFNQEIVDSLRRGGVVVARTDTIYGLLARADDETAVNLVYELKQRTPTKSPIVLISNPRQMYDHYDESVYKLLDQYWPGKNSMILPSDKGPTWITRGNQSIAYRLPDNQALLDLIEQTGPLIAPSANPESLPPANNIDEARAYFGERVDAYVDGGDANGAAASNLYRLGDGQLEQLR